MPYAHEPATSLDSNIHDKAKLLTSHGITRGSSFTWNVDLRYSSLARSTWLSVYWKGTPNMTTARP